MSTVVVGDLHGRIELAEAVLESDHDVIFIGDYLDSFDRSVEDQVQTLRTVIKAVEEQPDRVQALMGNHERSYFYPNERCSGYKNETAQLVQHIDISCLKHYIWHGEFLISHAGISQAFLESYSTNVQEYLDTGIYNQVGYARGGNFSCGGLYWCDWFREFEPVPGVPQIVGHSGYRPPGTRKGIVQNGNSWNIDCFEHAEEYLLIQDGTASIITIEDL